MTQLDLFPLQLKSCIAIAKGIEQVTQACELAANAMCSTQERTERLHTVTYYSQKLERMLFNSNCTRAGMEQSVDYSLFNLARRRLEGARKYVNHFNLKNLK